MRNVIKSLLLLVMTAMMVACGSSNTPSAVAEKATKCIIDKDFEGYVDMVYISDKNGTDAEKVETQKKQYAAMLEEKVTKGAEKDGKYMKSAKAVSEEISEDGKTATVKLDVKYDDGSEETTSMKLRTDDEGNWKVDSGK